MTDILQWFSAGHPVSLPHLKHLERKISDCLQSFKKITLYQYLNQPVTRDLCTQALSYASSISWLTHRCKSLMDSCAVLGSGWFMVVNEKLVPRVERKMALSVAARDTAIEWKAWLLNQAVALTAKRRTNEMNNYRNIPNKSQHRIISSLPS